MSASDDKVATSIAFALQVLGLDGVTHTPPEGSPLAEVVERERELREAGASRAEIEAALDELLRKQDEAEAAD